MCYYCFCRHIQSLVELASVIVATASNTLSTLPSHLFSLDFSVQQPDCFGNLLTKHLVITAASCFVELNYMLQCNERNRKHQSKQDIIDFDSIKESINIKNTLIAQVSYVKYLLSVKCRLSEFCFLIGYPRCSFSTL